MIVADRLMTAAEASRVPDPHLDPEARAAYYGLPVDYDHDSPKCTHTQCPVCTGTGGSDAGLCPACRGSGSVNKAAWESFQRKLAAST